MCEKKQRVTLSELILAAVCTLQEKNGVTACEIAEYVANKRGCKLSQIENMINIILCKAKNHGILSENKGLFRIEERYDDLQTQKNDKDKAPVTLSEDSDDDDDNDDEDDDQKEKCDPCACLKLSQDCLDDDEEEDSRCGKSKRRKCS